MPIFEVQGPDGSLYEVDAPNETTAAQAAGQMFGAKPSQPDKSYTGKILPFSTDAQGRAHFDSDAGIVGAVKRAVTLPRDWMEGKVDPNSEEAIARTLEAASLFGPVNPGVRAGDRAIPGVGRAVRRESVEPPSASALQSTARGQYDRLRDLGVDYKSASIRDVAGTVQAGLEKDGILGELAPQTFDILGKLQSPPPNSVAPISHVEAARRALGRVAREGATDTEKGAAVRAVKGLEDFIRAADPQSVVAGPAAEAGRVVDAARGNYAAYKRSDLLTGKEYAADLRASAANSGQNIGNSIRQRLADVLLRDKERAGYSPEEVAALEGVVRGSRGANTTRFLGNLLGGGGGLGMASTGGMGAALGAALGGPAGAAIGGAVPPLTGRALKITSNSLTRRALHGVDEAVRMRSPLYEDMRASAPMSVVTPEGRAALIRALQILGPQSPRQAKPYDPYEG